MSIFLTLVVILQSFSISLGVGSSTLAITNFFVAIKDGTIDDTERRMMGIVYVVLRVAMVMILLTTIFLVSSDFGLSGLAGISTLAYAQLLVLLVLYGNAMLMTADLVPSTFGPALQAGSWYTLGTLSALQILGYTDFTFGQFFLAYVTWLILAIGIVNAIMEIMKAKLLNGKAK